MSDFIEPIETEIESNEGYRFEQRPDILEVCEKLNEVIERYNAIAADYLDHLANDHNVGFEENLKEA